MNKGYWVVAYRSVSDPAAVARYAGPAAELIKSHGGRILARGMPARVFESGEEERCVLVEFDGVEAAIAAYESPDYQRVRAILQGAAERDIRIVEGV